MYQDTTWYGGMPQPMGRCVRWGPSSSHLKGHSPQFWANVRCGQTTGWTKMPFGVEVGLGPGDFVLDGVPAPPMKGAQPPVFGPCLLWPNGWMDEDATWYGSSPRSLPHCVRRGPSSPPRKGHSSLPSFRPMSIVTTVVQLSYC